MFCAIDRVQHSVQYVVFLPSLHAVCRCFCRAEPPGRCTPHCCYLESAGGPPSANSSVLGVNLRTHPSSHCTARGRGWMFKDKGSYSLLVQFASLTLYSIVLSRNTEVYSLLQLSVHAESLEKRVQ